MGKRDGVYAVPLSSLATFSFESLFSEFLTVMCWLNPTFLLICLILGESMKPSKSGSCSLSAG